MSHREDCFYIGRIVKKYGFKGEVVLKLDTDVPEAYSQMESLFLLRAGAMVPFFIEKSSLSGEYMRIKFEGVDTEDAAQAILRSEAYLPINCLPDLGEGKFYYHEIKGYKAVDAVMGLIGIVTGVNDSSAQALFEIDCDGREVLIPVVDDFIQKVDKKNKTLYLKTPEGLLDLYLSGQGDDFRDED